MESASPVRWRIVLSPQPESAGRARIAVRELLTRCALDELVDTATLLVSELVTNAVLHAATPVELRCHVEAETLCVQVGDRSSVLPGRRHYDDDALTGRGLGMVELLAAAWGIEGDEHGKTVWFQLASGDVEVEALPPVPSAGHEEWHGDQFDVHFSGVPTALVSTTVQYGDSLLRELALRTIASQPSRDDLSLPASHIDLGPLLDAVSARADDGAASVDITVSFPAGAGAAAFERLSLMDEADRLARDGMLLSPPALPEIVACRRWLLSQVGLQEEGEAPVRWELPSPLSPVLEPAQLPDDERRRLDGLTTGAMVADDANRIIYVNQAAAALLGWEVDELLDQRLVSIVPPELREAHLAGFGRYLITAEPRLLGRPMQLPALCRDGGQVDLELTIESIDVGEHRIAFIAALAPVEEA